MDTQEECISKLKAWKPGIESKGLHVNMKTTKFLVSGGSHDVLKKSGKYPCAVCCSGIGNNSIQCSQCMLWVHKKWSGITKRLRADPNYVGPRCKGQAQPIYGRTVTEVNVNDTMLNEATFCYLGDMLSSGKGWDSAIAAWCCVTLGKFRKPLPVITTRHLSPRIQGQMYKACVRPFMFYSSQSWGPNNYVHQRLRCNDCAMIRWICGIKRQATRHPQLHHYRNSALRILRRSFTVSGLDCMAMYSEPRPVSTLSLESKQSLRRHGLNVCWLMSISVA